jgi:hypothetical protein
MERRNNAAPNKRHCFLAPRPHLPTMIAIWTVVSGSAGFFLPDLWIKVRTKRR